MSLKVFQMRTKDIENIIHKILDPSWRIADRDNRAISKLATMVKKLLDKAHDEGYEEGYDVGAPPRR